MFVPIRDGKAFDQGKYSKAFYYLSICVLIGTIIIYLGGCNWIIAMVEKLFFSGKNEKVQKIPEYKDIEMDFEEDYWHYYPYFKISNKQ